MPTILAFIEQDELTELLRDVGRKFGLRYLVFETPAAEVVDESQLTIGDDASLAFMLPSSQPLGERFERDSVEPKLWGWAQVNVGGLYGDTLTITQISGTAADGSNPAPWIRALRRRLTYGVRAARDGEDAVHEVKHIAYSPGAVQRWRQGVTWRQAPGYRTSYQPIEEGGG